MLDKGKIPSVIKHLQSQKRQLVKKMIDLKNQDSLFRIDRHDLYLNVQTKM